MHQREMRLGNGRIIAAGAILALAVALLGVWTIGEIRAEVEDSDDVIHACADLESGHLRWVSSEGACLENENPVTWNVQGPEGPPGPAGEDGVTDVNVNFTGDEATHRINGFISIDGLEGEATEGGFDGWSRIYGLDRAIHNPVNIGARGGAGAGKAELDAIKVDKHVDSMTPGLFQATASGKHFPTAEIVLLEHGANGPIAFYRYELEKVFVSSQQVGKTDPQTGDPMESLALEFGKITITYTPIGEDGTPGEPIEASWDQVRSSR